MSEKKFYKKPVLEYCGSVSERTLGGPSGPVLDQNSTTRFRHKGGNN